MNIVILTLVVIVFVLVAFKFSSTYSPAPSPGAPAFAIQDQYSDTIISMVRNNQSVTQIIQALQAKGLTAQQAFERVTKDPHFGHQG